MFRNVQVRSMQSDCELICKRAQRVSDIYDTFLNGLITAKNQYHQFSIKPACLHKNRRVSLIWLTTWQSHSKIKIRYMIYAYVRNVENSEDSVVDRKRSFDPVLSHRYQAGCTIQKEHLV